jgi:DNA repair protein RadC
MLMLHHKECKGGKTKVELKKLRKRPKAGIRRPEDAVDFMRHMEDYDRERAKILHLDKVGRFD